MNINYKVEAGLSNVETQSCKCPLMRTLMRKKKMGKKIP